MVYFSKESIAQAIVASPVTFVVVRIISRILSTPNIRAIPSLGTLIASKIMTGEKLSQFNLENKKDTWLVP